MMKKLVMVLAAIMILTGATVSVMKTLGLGPFADKAQVAAAEAKARANIPEPPRFIDLEPLVVPIFNGDEIVATIQISVKLEAIGAANETKINRIKPRLNDAYIKDLYSFIPRLLRNQERVNVFIIKKRLQMVSDKLVGEGIISDVLVQSITDTSQQR